MGKGKINKKERRKGKERKGKEGWGEGKTIRSQEKKDCCGKQMTSQFDLDARKLQGKKNTNINGSANGLQSLKYFDHLIS